MRKVLAFFLLWLGSGALAGAAPLAKPYFGATVPGSWVTYLSTSEEGQELRYTYTRLPDHGGRAVVEFRMEALAGPGAGSTSQQLFVMEAGFDPAEDALNRMKHVETIVMQAGEGEPILQSSEIVSIIREGAASYQDGFELRGATTVDGVGCDLYGFEATMGGAGPTTEIGELCLSASVPFGVVKKSSRYLDENGQPASATVMVLQERGTGATGSPTLLAKIPETRPTNPAKAVAQIETLELAKAYRQGLVGFQVEVVPGTSGRRLRLSLVNRSSREIRVELAPGPASFEAGAPVHSLDIAVSRREALTIPPGIASSPIDVGQRGDRGATEGSFALSVYEGEPIFTGSVTMGTLGR